MTPNLPVSSRTAKLALTPTVRFVSSASVSSVFPTLLSAVHLLLRVPTLLWSLWETIVFVPRVSSCATKHVCLAFRTVSRVLTRLTVSSVRHSSSTPTVLAPPV